MKSGTNRRSSSTLTVKVRPGGSKDRVVGRIGDEWKLTLKAPPVEGRANRACIDLLARLLRVPRSRVRLVHGQTSRRKLIEIEGLSLDQVAERLDAATTRQR